MVQEMGSLGCRFGVEVESCKIVFLWITSWEYDGTIINLPCRSQTAAFYTNPKRRNVQHFRHRNR